MSEHALRIENGNRLPVLHHHGLLGPPQTPVVPVAFMVVPLLVQMGDLDTEGPPQDCISRLQEQKDKGAPIELVVYKNTTHGWDIGSNFTKTAANGQRVVYRYNPKVTADSVERALDFLDRHVRASNQNP